MKSNDKMKSKKIDAILTNKQTQSSNKMSHTFLLCFALLCFGSFENSKHQLTDVR